MTLVEHSVALFSRLGKVLVLCHPDLRGSLAGLALPAELLVNPNPEWGMFSSVHLGIGRLAGGEGVFVLPVDCPLVQERTLKLLIASAQAKPQCAVHVPVFAGKRGHPVLLMRAAFNPILAQEPTAIFSTVLATIPVAEVQVEDPAVLLNVNTPLDYEHLVQLNSGRRKDT
jgi:CTP:molybdopterin cytidylyltransferase MocA